MKYDSSEEKFPVEKANFNLIASVRAKISHNRKVERFIRLFCVISYIKVKDAFLENTE